MAKFKEGYIVKVDEEIGKIFRVNENTCVVQFSDRRKVVRMESIEILDATENADIRTYKMYETKKCTECGITKPQFEFSKMRGNKLRNQCKECFGRMISEGHREKKAIRERAKALKESKQVAKPEQKPVVEPIKPIKNIEEWVEKNLNKENNAVVKPSHYVGTNGLEVKQVLEEFVKDKAGMVAHIWCSAVEYLLRAYEKNGQEDLEKAKMNIEWLIAEKQNAE